MLNLGNTVLLMVSGIGSALWLAAYQAGRWVVGLMGIGIGSATEAVRPRRMCDPHIPGAISR